MATSAQRIESEALSLSRAMSSRCLLMKYLPSLRLTIVEAGSFPAVRHGGYQASKRFLPQD